MSKQNPVIEQAFREAALRSTTQRYAVLQFLERTEVLLAGKAARFDANLRRHHHFVCEECGVVEDIPRFDLPHSSKASAGPRQFRSYEIIFRGASARYAAGAHA